DLLGIAESVLVAEQNKILLENRKKQRTNSPSEVQVDMPQFPVEEEMVDQFDISKIIEYQERESIRVLVNYGKNKIQTREMTDQNLIEYFLNEAEEIQFTNETYRKIIEVFREKLNEGEIIDGEYLLNHKDENIRKTVVDLSTDKYELSKNWTEKYQIHIPRETEFLRDVTYTNVLRLKFRIIQQLIQEETEKLKHSTDESEIDELLDDINELKKVSVEIADILGNVIVG
ncbi:MAG: DNA primase, partial [Bacteroidota bacterium]